jgi:hypothetical protein
MSELGEERKTVISERPTLLCSHMSSTQQENQPAVRSTFPAKLANRLPQKVSFV